MNCVRDGCDREASRLAALELVNGHRGHEFEVPLCYEHAEALVDLKADSGRPTWFAGRFLPVEVPV